LNTVRAIRNDFAHEYGDISFSNQSVKDRCKNIETPVEMLVPSELPELDLSGEKEISALKISKADSNDPRACFHESVTTLEWILTGRYVAALESGYSKSVDFTAAHEQSELILKSLKPAIHTLTTLVETNIAISPEEKSI